MHWLFEPGIWSNAAVRTGTGVGVVVAAVSALVGLFTVVRSQSFAGHALADVATAGGAGAGLFGFSPLGGFVIGSLLGAGAMEAIGVERVRQRDVATGIVLGGATGLSALFLYLITLNSSRTGSTQSILFGSLFSVSNSSFVLISALSLVVILALGALGRPLLLTSVSPDAARARGVAVRRVALAYTLLMAVTVGLSAIVIGSVLSTALLIGPPAAALRLGRRLGASLVMAVVLGALAVVAGVVASYDSYYWWPSHRALPVSFCVVTMVVVELIVTSALARRAGARDASGRA
ncbi:MAG: metal ABC transporter permease [Acidobacteriota bacterium]|nr:metal ABC transporter permease [Acidobacteriota bacterium]MDE3147101.1 metal ABC transporter permease [Acidobacteriota bacterium]